MTHSVKTPFGYLSRQSVLDTLKEVDKLGRDNFLKKYGYGEAKRYQLFQNGRLYDSKAVYGVAFLYESDQTVRFNDFSGGKQQVVSMLERLGFKIHDLEKDGNFLLPEEYSEGRSIEVKVNRKERDPKARAACLKEHGYICIVCELNFAEKFGSGFEGLIHVHHLTPLSTRKGEYMFNHKTELVPVCPNCHAMIHHGNQLRTIEEMKEIINTD